MKLVRYYRLPNQRVPFREWLTGLSDKPTRAAVLRRIDRLADGNFGDCRFLRNGVFELRIDVGPGYRVYFAQSGEAIVLLLCGGSKRTQGRDIDRAVGYWNEHQAQ